MSMPLCSTTSSTTVPLPSSFQASRATSPLPHIAYFSIFICCTRHMLLRYFPIQMHSLSLSPLVVPFLYPMQPIINIIYSSEPCALLVNRIRQRAVITLGVIADTIYIQLLQVRHIADAQGNLQRRDSAESLLVSLTSFWARISLSSPAR